MYVKAHLQRSFSSTHYIKPKGTQNILSVSTFFLYVFAIESLFRHVFRVSTCFSLSSFFFQNFTKKRTLFIEFQILNKHKC